MDQPDTRGQAAAASAPELSVVIPAYNEAGGIAATTRQLAEWLSTRATRWELWVVDDGSTDRTRTIVETLARELDGLAVDGFAENRGRGAALRHGLRRARGQVVVSTEADLSWGLDVLQQLAALVQTGGADVAVASPHGRAGQMVGVPWRRRVLSRSANRVASLALGRAITMATGATRAYRREILPEILSPLDGKAFHLDTLCRALRAGAAVREVPATLQWRDATRRRRPLGGSQRLAHEIAAHLKVLTEHVYLSRRSA